MTSTPNLSCEFTIDGWPILMDADGTIARFLADYLPSFECLFGSQELEHAAVIENDKMEHQAYFTDLYPPLPPIGLNQIQWPQGTSRYGRALFLVENNTLAEIAKDVWKSPIVSNTATGFPPIPDNWGIGEHDCRVRITAYNTIDFRMRPLPPYAITVPTANSQTLFLLPMVDHRFLVRSQQRSANVKFSSWDTAIQSTMTDLGWQSNFGSLNIADTKPAEELGAAGIPEVLQLDQMAFAISRRMTVTPDCSVGPQDAINADAARKATIDSGLQIAGGSSGRACMARELRLVGIQQDGYRPGCKPAVASATIAGGMAGLAVTSRHCVQTSYSITDNATQDAPKQGDFDSYAQTIAADYPKLAGKGDWYCFQGVPDYHPSAHDNYLLVSLTDSEGKPTCVTRLIGLPLYWHPRALLAVHPQHWSYSQSIAEFEIVTEVSGAAGTAKFVDESPNRVVFLKGPRSGLSVPLAPGQVVQAYHTCQNGWTIIAGSGGSGAGTELNLVTAVYATSGAVRVQSRLVKVIQAGTTNDSDLFFFGSCGTPPVTPP